MHPWPGSPATNSENRLTHFQQAHPHNFFAKHNDSVCHMFAPPFSENIDLQGSVYHGYAVGVKMSRCLPGLLNSSHAQACLTPVIKRLSKNWGSGEFHSPDPQFFIHPPYQEGGGDQGPSTLRRPCGACLAQVIDHRDQSLLLRQCLDKLTGKLAYLCWAGALDGLLGQWAGHFQVDTAYKILDAGNAGRIHA